MPPSGDSGQCRVCRIVAGARLATGVSPVRGVLGPRALPALRGEQATMIPKLHIDSRSWRAVVGRTGFEQLSVRWSLAESEAVGPLRQSCIQTKACCAEP